MRISFDAPVFSDTKKDEPVDCALHRKFQLVDRQLRIVEREILSQRLPPGFDFLQKFPVDSCSATFAVSDCILVEGPFEYGLLGKDRGNLVPFGKIVPVRPVVNAADARLIGRIRSHAAVVDGEFFEVAQNRKRQLGRPGIAAKLIGRGDLVFDIDGGFLGFKKKLTRTADAETVIRCFGVAADLDCVFMNNIFVRLGMPLLVSDISAKRAKERIDKFPAELCFVVALALVRISVLFESIDEIRNNGRCLPHRGLLVRMRFVSDRKNTVFPKRSHWPFVPSNASSTSQVISQASWRNGKER